jgi:uncharacterized membrane protein
LSTVGHTGWADLEGAVYTTYNLFKFLHVAAVIVWVGGLIALTVIPARLARQEGAAATAALGRQAAFYGRSVVGPAAVITLVAGIVMVVVGRLGFNELWIAYGFLGIVVSMGLGGGLLSRLGSQLAELGESDDPDTARIAALQARLRTFNAINVLILLSVVWAMVFKPTL